MFEQQPSYYTNIPASIRYDKDIPANAKLLYGEIGCLSNKYGYCFAKNDYFADLYGLSEDRISKLIHLLEKKGYVEIEVERNSQKFIINRKIKLLDPGLYASKVKNTDSNGKNNDGEKLKITASNGKNNGSNINTYNTNTINTNTFNNLSARSSSDTDSSSDNSSLGQSNSSSLSLAEREELEELRKQNELQKQQLKDKDELIKEQNKAISSKSSKTKKNEYHTLFDQSYYSPIVKLYNSEFVKVKPNGIPNSKDYKKYIDKVYIRLRELGLSDTDIHSKIISAIKNAHTSSYWCNQASGSFAYILSETGMSHLSDNTAVSKPERKINNVTVVEQDYGNDEF